MRTASDRSVIAPNQVEPYLVKDEAIVEISYESDKDSNPEHSSVQA
ncbi:hypothetical protein [Nostoc sp.]